MRVWPMVRDGFSAELGSWKTIWMRRWVARSRRSVSACPSKVMPPEVTGTSPTSALARVEFQQPDSPTMPSDAPRSTSRLTWSSAVKGR